MTLAVVTRKEERITAAPIVHEAFVDINTGRHRAHLIKAAGKSGVATATIVCLALINIGTNRTGTDLIGAGEEGRGTAASVVGLAFIYIGATLTIAGVSRLAATNNAANSILAGGIDITTAVVF